MQGFFVCLTISVFLSLCVCCFTVTEFTTLCTNSRVVVTVEGLKVVEIEKCKNDLKKLRDEMTSRGGGRYGDL